MRKITKESVNAFMNDNNFSKSNTRVNVDNSIGVTFLYLHGNIIAMKYHSTNKIKISNAGWFSVTTKERLNGLPNVSIKQKNYEWILNGNLWNGEWIEIS